MQVSYLYDHQRRTGYGGLAARSKLLIGQPLECMFPLPTWRACSPSPHGGHAHCYSAQPGGSDRMTSNAQRQQPWPAVNHKPQPHDPVDVVKAEFGGRVRRQSVDYCRQICDSHQVLKLASSRAKVTSLQLCQGNRITAVPR